MNELIHLFNSYACPPPFCTRGSNLTCSHLMSKRMCFMWFCQRKRPTITLGNDTNEKMPVFFLAVESSLVNSGALSSPLPQCLEAEQAGHRTRQGLSVPGWVSSVHLCLLWLSLSSLTGIVFGTLNIMMLCFKCFQNWNTQGLSFPFCLLRLFQLHTCKAEYYARNY